MAISEGSNAGALNGTTAVELVAAPAASTTRAVRSIHILNGDTVPHDFVLYKKVGASSYPIDAQAAVPAGQGWRPIANADVLLLTDTDESLTADSDATATTDEPTFEASFYDRS